MRSRGVCTCGAWASAGDSSEDKGQVKGESVPGGVSLGGFFVLERWMFSEASPPGASFPPEFDAKQWAAVFPSPWRSEGHLSQLLAEHLGPQGAIRAFDRH